MAFSWGWSGLSALVWGRVVGKLVAVSIGVVSSLVPVVAGPAWADSRTTLFEETFESGSLEQWSYAWNWAIVNASSDSDGKKARSLGSTGQKAELVKAISTRSWRSMVLSFSYRISGYENGDMTEVQILPNLSNGWQMVAQYTAVTDGWQQVELVLPDIADDQEEFQFRFYGLANGADDYFYVDNVRLSGVALAVATPTVEPSPELTPLPTVTPTPTGQTSPTPPVNQTEEEVVSVGADNGSSQVLAAVTAETDLTTPSTSDRSNLPLTGGHIKLGQIGWWCIALGVGIGLLWKRRPI